MGFDVALAEEIWTAKYRFAPAEGVADEDYAATVDSSCQRYRRSRGTGSSLGLARTLPRSDARFPLPARGADHRRGWHRADR